MKDYFVEIAVENWQKLRDSYKRNSVAFCTIDNFIRFLARDLNVKHIHLFCLNGDYSDGTFAAFVSYLKQGKIIV